MEITIRQESPNDFNEVFSLIEKAFRTEQLSDHSEQFLVERLRKSSAFIPELSIVAEIGNRVVGHILLTKLKIKNDQHEFDSLALAPASVLPEYQRKGIGGMLIEQAHIKAKELGHKSIVLVGHENYYPRFGYQQADKQNPSTAKMKNPNTPARHGRSPGKPTDHLGQITAGRRYGLGEAGAPPARCRISSGIHWLVSAS